MRLENWVYVCVVVFTSFFFSPPQVIAAELTDTEIGEFRALLEERKPTKEAPAKPLTDEEAGSLRTLLDQFKDITFGGFLVNYYQYWSSNPDAGDSVGKHPLLHNTQVNSFTMKDIALWLYKDAPNPGDIGFKITLNWGDMARRYTLVAPVTDDGIIDQPIDPAPGLARTGGRQTTFSEGYILWNIPVGKGLTAMLGKFPTWLGFEVQGSISNPNFSLSYTNGWGTPGRTTGLGLTYDLTDRLTASYYITDTSSAFVNNNKSLTHGIKLYYVLPDLAFLKKPWVNFNTLWGPEQALNNSDWTQRYNLTIAFSIFDRLTFITNGNWISDAARIEQRSGRRKKGNNAWGVVQYLIYDYSNSLEFAVRGEYFWDRDNVSGISGTGGASLTEVTGTINYRMTENFWFRPEVRYDKVVSAPNGTSHIFHRQNKNITATFAVVYEF